jgi:hypothetical protein
VSLFLVCCKIKFKLSLGKKDSASGVICSMKSLMDLFHHFNNNVISIGDFDNSVMLCYPKGGVLDVETVCSTVSLEGLISHG